MINSAQDYREMSLNKIVLRDFLLFWGIVFAVILFSFQSRGNPIVRPRIERIEAFQGAAAKVDVNPYVVSQTELQPGDPALSAPREPYNLLKGMLPDATVRTSPNSKRCYETDFQTRIEKTGDFRQLTNNYKRGEPDSCSGLLHEFVLSFYKPEVLP